MQQCFEHSLALIEKKHNLNFEHIVVAVSGGADSLALAFLMADYAKKKNIKIVALTVNHHLRDEATSEAEYVCKLMEAIDVEHHTLDWCSNNPKTGIEEKAREARYALIEEWCQKNGYENVLMAHHQKDQAETFIMRLQRGSGVDGLASMSDFSIRGNINIIRPLLDVSPEALQEYLKSKNIKWVEDSSNDCDSFLRVRIRKLLPVLEKELGISVKRIADTAAALGSVKEYFEDEVEKFVESNVKFWKSYAVSFAPKSVNDLPKEIKLRVLSALIKKIGLFEYPPTYDELERLAAVLLSEDFKGCTLGGCEITKFQGKIWIIRELKVKKTLSKADWESFVQNNQEYKNVSVPYKLKQLLIKDRLVF